eukprot:2937769-Amphidinium_carterae.1
MQCHVMQYTSEVAMFEEAKLRVNPLLLTQFLDGDGGALESTEIYYNAETTAEPTVPVGAWYTLPASQDGEQAESIHQSTQVLGDRRLFSLGLVNAETV